MENEYKSEYYDLMSIEVLIQALEKMRHRHCSIASFDFLLERIEILHEVEKEVIALKNKQIEQMDLIKTTASKTHKNEN
jgi:protoheme ferro-lyase